MATLANLPVYPPAAHSVQRSSMPEPFVSRFESRATQTSAGPLGARQPAGTNVPSAADFYVPHIKGLPDNTTLSAFSGHLPSSTDSDAHLFFLLFKNEHIADKERFVIWLNGGPGCSSFDGALLEVGPLRMVQGEQGVLKKVDHSWSTFSNVLFLDQPAGTGYSYVSTNNYVHELPDAADQVVNFMERFYQVFPEMKYMDTYIAGESFAGQYIPYTADAVMKASERLNMPLKGLLIGNGWMSPSHQYESYLPFAYENNILSKESPEAKKLEKSAESCRQHIKESNTTGAYRVSVDACESILTSLLSATIQNVDGKKLCINAYDMRLTDEHPKCGMNWPPGLQEMYDYLPKDDVKQSYHASAKDGGWIECSGQVGSNFWAKSSAPSIDILPGLLEQGLEVMIFAGDQDIICNWQGLENMINDLEWNGAKGLQNSQVLDWEVDGKQVGTWTSARGLSWVKLYNASHMVGYDVPDVAHDMLLRFQNVDRLQAAGLTGQVPSRVGNESTGVLGFMGSDQQSGSSSSTGTGSPNSDDKVSDIVSESYYNVGTAAALLFLFIVGIGGFLFCRKRLFRDQSSFSKKFGNGSSTTTTATGAGGGPARTIFSYNENDEEQEEYNDGDDTKQKRRQSRKGYRGLGGGAPYHDDDYDLESGRTTGATSKMSQWVKRVKGTDVSDRSQAEPHELATLVKDDGFDEEDKPSSSLASSQSQSQSQSQYQSPAQSITNNKGKQRETPTDILTKDEDVFSLGPHSSDDEK